MNKPKRRKSTRRDIRNEEEEFLENESELRGRNKKKKERKEKIKKA